MTRQLVALAIACFTNLLTAQGGLPPLSANDVITGARVSDPQISPDGKHVVYNVGTPSLEKNRTANALWIATLEGAAAPAPMPNGEGLTNPRWSPDSSKLLAVGVVDGVPQVHVIAPDGSGRRAITKVPNGVDAPMWSPDGTRVVFAQEVWPNLPGDEAQRAKNKEVESVKTSAKTYDDLMIRHWNFWRDGKRPQLFVVNVEKGGVVQLTDGDRDNPPWSLGGPQAFAFSGDGARIYFTRGPDPKKEAWSTNADLASVAVTGGEVTIHTASNPGYDGGPVPSPDGRWVAFRSQARDGYESDLWRLMLLDTKSGAVRRVGKALPDAVEELVWVGGSTTIGVAVQDSGSHAWFLLDIETDELTQVHAGPNAFGVTVSSDGKIAACTQVSLVTPPEVYTYDISKRSAHRVSTHGAWTKTRLMPTRDQMTWKGAGGAIVHGFRVLPPGFSPEDKRPAIVLIHGGPQSAWMDGWSTRWNPAIYAAAGYVVFCPNPRGSTGYGPEFCEQISGDWGGAVFEDIMKGVDAVIAEGGIDATRLGAAGGSYGGYMVNWILGHEHRFKALVSHAGVYNLESMYGTTEEIWFAEWEFKGAPFEDRTLYERWSPHRFASAFKTPTLIIHGELDYRVPVNQGLELFTTLRRKGVASRLVVYPDEGHWVLKPHNGLKWNAEVMGWFDRYLKP